jgi:hypothetical protein
MPYNNSLDNNFIQLAGKYYVNNFTPRKNTNPQATRDIKYIALSGIEMSALYLLTSPDGIRWKEPQNSLITTNGAFDSQNVIFWDSHAKLYRCYFRVFRPWPIGRAFATCTSPDLQHWTTPRDIEYDGDAVVDLYTNAIQTYPRAPHLILGFPTRLLRSEKYQTQPEFMSSRDGVRFHHWTDPIIPTTAPKDRDGNRGNYMAYGYFELPDKPGEYSFYAMESTFIGPAVRLRRFTYRIDGFVSISAGTSGGTIVTKLLTFNGKELVINGTTKSQGNISVEIRDDQGHPINGLAYADCERFTGDSVEHVVRWQNNADLHSLAGKPIQLRFVLKEADLYSFRFR